MSNKFTEYEDECQVSTAQLVKNERERESTGERIKHKEI